MLTNLLINNVALIDEAEINFGAGLNILTGETGAGKSMLIDSINFMLGGRPGKDFIRNGAETAFVEGLFEINSNIVKKQIAELGIELNGENQLHISRSINNSGKNVCRINGRAAAVGMLKETSALLVDVHGQHEHQSLLNVNRHIHFLDAFCGDKLTILKSKLNECLIKYRDTIKKLNELTGGSRGEEQAEIWRYQINEIKQAKLLNGEEERLNAKRKRLGGVEKLARFAAEALDLLRGGDSNTAASDQIGRALYCLAEIEKLDAEKKELADTLGDAASIVSDVVRELREYADSLDADPAELELIESRLDVIYRLKNKYGSTVADVLAHCEKISGRLEQYENSGILIKENETLKRKQTQEIIEICKCMSSIRTEKAGQIKKQIETVLKSLGIDHAVFEIKIDKKKEFNSNGNDRAEFLISPNLGEPLKPLSQIASGGEMSRIMLAVKTILADTDPLETLIFDEIDAGVSGKTAHQVAEKLGMISRTKQILCITHLPQIAAMADSHFLIEKNTSGGKTATRVILQNESDMVNEIARLIGGVKITDATLKAADDLKSHASSVKRG